MLKIVEILRRSHQGMTRPYLCRCDDDQLYFVKGRDAGPRSLLCEWLAGHLAISLELPVPSFAILQAPKALIDVFPDGKGLGPGPVFGSHAADSVQELGSAHLPAIPTHLQRDVLVFDWWVRNQDRSLTSLDGNPNLLWRTENAGLVVIDHNLAFDRDFDVLRFRQTHVFAAQLPALLNDREAQAQYKDRLDRAMAVWPVACASAPAAWWYMDEECTVPTDFDPTTTHALLNRYLHDEFWRLA